MSVWVFLPSHQITKAGQCKSHSSGSLVCTASLSTDLPVDPPGAFSSLGYSAEPAVTDHTGLPTEKLDGGGSAKGTLPFNWHRGLGAESWTRWGLSKWSQESRSLPERNTPGRNTHASVMRGDLIIRAHAGPKVKCTEREGPAAHAIMLITVIQEEETRESRKCRTTRGSFPFTK